MSRWLGFTELLVDAVTHGASAIERVHRAAAARPLRLIALVPPLAAPARGLLAVQDGIIAGVYGTVRATARVVGGAVGVVLQASGAQTPGVGPP